MKPINHPLYGRLGAFWVEGHDQPFFSLHDALNYQYKNGGNVLGQDGKILYLYAPPTPTAHTTPDPSMMPSTTSSPTQSNFNNALTPQKKSWWASLFSKA